MTGRSFGRALAIFAVVAPGAGAQGIDNQCAIPPSNPPAIRITQDACQKAIDLFSYLAPQLGAAVAGGNAVSGEHSSLGGPGGVSWGLRVNAARARLPRIDQVTPAVTGAVQTDFEIREQVVPVPTLDAAFGALRGTPVGVTRVLGLDLLVNVAFVPSLEVDDVAVSVYGSGLRLGFGARLGLMEETSFIPGVALTYIQRSLPRAKLTARPGNDEITVDNLQLRTRSWRIVAGKRLGFFALSAGAGQDKLENSAIGAVTLDRAGAIVQVEDISAVQLLTRDNLFGSVSIVLPVLRIVGEIGRTSGGTIGTFNTFGTSRADDPIEFASIGLRLRW